MVDKFRLIDPEDPSIKWVITLDKDGKVISLKEVKDERTNRDEALL